MTNLQCLDERLIDVSEAREIAARLVARLRAVVIGRDEVVGRVIEAFLAGGHVLLEDYPGSGKTTLARALGESIRGDAGEGMAPFRRIQFTPDLLPSDITGVSVFDPTTTSFEFRRGPVFAWVLLADEINRSGPKVQSALLESMAEKQVTVENTTHRLDDLFFVIATQNPRDVAGTYPLPTPQLDRILFKIPMQHIEREAELEVLKAAARPARAWLPEPVTREEVLAARACLRSEVRVSECIHECIVDTARALRAHPGVAQGVSTRSLVQMVPALQAAALLDGREFVSAVDIELLAPLVFSHRMVMARPGEDPDQVVRECLREPIDRLARRTLFWR